jgi:hypothetical protein
MIHSAAMKGWPLWACAGVIVLATSAAAMAIARTASPAPPTGDMAIIESYTIQASEGRLLVGPYSRFGWHHPGPIYFYALVPFYLGSHRDTAGLNAAAIVFNVFMIAVATLVAASAGGPVLAVVLAAATTVLVFRADGLLVSAWNPHVVVLPMVVAVTAAAAAAAGQAWWLPLAALAASFAAETHIGTLPTVALVCGLAVVVVLASTNPTRRAARPWKALAATAIVLAVAWLPSIAEQVRHAPGNLSALWKFFLTSAGAAQPLRTAFIAWSSMLAGIARPDFGLASGVPLRITHGWAPQAWAIGELVLLATVAAISARQRRRFEMFLSLFALAASLAALWSVTRVLGELIDHEIFWISALGALNAAVIVASIAGLAGPHAQRNLTLPATAVCAVLLAVCAAAGLAGLADIRARSRAADGQQSAIARAAAGVREYVRAEGIDRPFVDVDQKSWGLAAGVLLQLQKAGVGYAVDDDWVPMFTDAAKATGREERALSIAGAERHVMIAGQPGVVAVVASDPVYVDAYGVRPKR